MPQLLWQPARRQARLLCASSAWAASAYCGTARPVQLGEWPSKKARDLLKILVARRCRPVARVQLLDLLWPDQGESVASPRLSVALSTVRSVLDPAKQYSPDQFVGADRATIWLDGDQTAVDVEVLPPRRTGRSGR